MVHDDNVLVKVLSDSVTDKDELGSHQRIADAIADVIETDDEGKAIALTGSWGSGKSSVVEMLRRKLDKNTKVVMFDAWAHENDPLRRSFIEQLINKLSAEGWIKRENWLNTLDELSKRSETTVVKQHSIPTTPAIILVIAITAVPFGVALLAKGWTNLSNELKFLAAIMTLLPCLFATIGLILYKVLKDPQKRRKWLSLVSSDADKELRSNTYRTPDPTTIEFHEKYTEILGEALKEKKRKLLIVIDNLDRVDIRCALAIWANMKTFLDYELLEHEPWSKRIWLLVPFDHGAIKRLWDKENSEDLALPFLDKTFQLIFHVPPPVLSNWAEYFKDKLKCALPRIKNDGEIHNVYRIFRLKKYSGATAPTPREIKRFINRLGVLYRQWHDQISLNTMALYVVLEANGAISIESMQRNDPALTEHLSAGFVGQDFLHELAAIYFNVEKDRAAHVLLGPKLDEAINMRDEESFGVMQSQYGFDEVLEEVIEENISDWVKKASIFIAWLGKVLDNSKISENECIRRTWNLLTKGAAGVEQWLFIDKNTGEGIVRLIRHNNTPSFVTAVMKSMAAVRLAKPEKQDIVGWDEPENWLAGCLPVLKTLDELHHEDIIKEHFRCPGDELTYIEIIKAAAQLEEHPSQIKYLLPSIPSDAVITVLTQIISEGKCTGIYRTVIRILSDLGVISDWEKITKAMSSRLYAPNKVTDDELAALLETLIDLAASKDVALVGLRTLALSGHIFHQLAAAPRASMASSLCLYSVLRYNPTGQISNPTHSMPAGQQRYKAFKSDPAEQEDIIAHITDLIAEHNDIEFLLKTKNNFDALKETAHAIIRQMIQKPNMTGIIDVSVFLEYEIDFYNALEEESYKEVISRYKQEAGLEERILESTFDPGLGSIYIVIYNLARENKSKLLTWIITGLKEIQGDRWIEEFDASYNNLYSLVVDLINDDAQIDLGVEFQEALVKYKELFNEGKDQKANLDEDWNKLLRALNDDLRKTLIDSIIDDVIDARVPNGRLITLFGPALLDCERLELKKDDIVQKGAIKFLREGKNEELEWFHKVIQTCPSITKRCRKEYRETLERHIRALVSRGDEGDETVTMAREIAASMGLEFPATDDKPVVE